MEVKKILVIGAGQSCLGIIRTIKKMGHQAVVVGNSEELPGIALADYYLITEDNDVDSVVSFCEKIEVDGIVPTPVDRPLVWMAKVAKRLGLNFLSVESAENFRHKFKMKHALMQANVSCAKGILTNPSNFSLSLLNGFSYPLIVKPIDGYASRGVTRANNDEELLTRIKEAATFSSNANFVIEEFIEGREFNAEGVVYNGIVELYAIVEKISDPFPRTIEMGHVIPPDITKGEDKIIADITTDAVLALGMENGTFNAEIKIHNRNANVIEVNGRLAGDFIISHLIKPTTGQDMEEAVVNISLGIPPEKAQRDYKKFGIISFYNLPVGKTIKNIKNDIDFLRITNGAKHNWHLFGILVPPEHKYSIMDALRAEGVMSNVHYTPLHRNKFYKGLATDSQMPGSMSFFSRLLRIPIYPSLTDDAVSKVIESVNKVFK
jgi:biotin carboxylase